MPPPELLQNTPKEVSAVAVWLQRWPGAPRMFRSLLFELALDPEHENRTPLLAPNVPAVIELLPPVTVRTTDPMPQLPPQV